MGAPHILLVEDSELVSEAMRVLFVETGHRVTLATTAADAIAAASSGSPDVMLLDLTGRGLAPRRTIALTGDGDDATIARCRAAGCHDVMLKPVPLRELLRKIGEWTNP